jgi:hypothetical protein
MTLRTLTDTPYRAVALLLVISVTSPVAYVGRSRKMVGAINPIVGLNRGLFDNTDACTHQNYIWRNLSNLQETHRESDSVFCLFYFTYFYSN